MGCGRRNPLTQTMKTLPSLPHLRAVRPALSTAGGIEGFLLSEMKQTHYVYQITAGWQYYIGVRSCMGDPDADRYRGSGNWCLFTIPTTPRVKRVLSVHETRHEAEIEEARLLAIHIGKFECRNIRRRTPKPIHEAT